MSLGRASFLINILAESEIYAYKIFFCTPGYTLVKAKKIFKQYYNLVESKYKLIVSQHKNSENLCNMSSTAKQFIKYMNDWNLKAEKVINRMKEDQGNEANVNKLIKLTTERDRMVSRLRKSAMQYVKGYAKLEQDRLKIRAERAQLNIKLKYDKDGKPLQTTWEEWGKPDWKGPDIAIFNAWEETLKKEQSILEQQNELLDKFFKETK